MSETPDQRTRRVLREHGLPEGLLPSGITEADIGDDGSFAVRLPRQVVRTHGGYKVRFGPAISGVLGEGKVRKLEGVEAKQFLWFAVGGIDAEGDKLVFSVGPAKVPLPVSEFPS